VLRPRNMLVQWGAISAQNYPDRVSVIAGNMQGDRKPSKRHPSTPPREAGATPEASEAGRKTGISRANARALSLAPIIAEIQADGVTRPHAIAAALTDRGVPTALGHRFWRGTQVRHVLDRLARLAPPSPVGSQSCASSGKGRIEKPLPIAEPLIDLGGTKLSDDVGKPITFSKGRRRGRPTATEIVGQILMQIRTEGSALRESHVVLAKMVAARNNRSLGDRSWNETTIVKHVREWLRQNPDPNDYRVALTLKEAARESGVNRALLDVAVGRGTLRAHKCGARTLILQSDLQRFVTQNVRRRARN
jgi:hypothetical protein